MKFSEDKKRAIKMYIVEKIANSTPNITKQVAEIFNISRNTVNAYMTQLQENGIIRKIQKNQYELVTEIHKFRVWRSKNELTSETAVFEKCIKPYILQCTPEARAIWDYASNEMLNNVIDHSDADRLDVIVKRNFYSTTVMLIDDGVGIFEKLKNYFNLESLDAARCELFKGKLTTNAQMHSGEGIFFTSRVMDTFLIISSGKIFSTNKYNSDVLLDAPVGIRKGTAVYMSLNNHTHRQLAEVFKCYADVENGFDKTTIPLKNIFDDAPVSRSQAKRICYRLENFAEVTFDFAGINWVGQAFAHQIFVLYQREHPTMRLKAVNMCENVYAMYQHVMNTK